MNTVKSYDKCPCKTETNSESCYKDFIQFRFFGLFYFEVWSPALVHSIHPHHQHSKLRLGTWDTMICCLWVQSLSLSHSQESSSWYKHQKCTLCTVLCGGRREWQLIPGSMCSKGASTEVVLQRNSERWVLHSQDLVGDLQVSWQWTITEIRSSPRTMPFGWLQTFNAESSVNSLALHCAS